MPAFAFDRLTEAQLEELVVQLLAAESGSAARYVARVRDTRGAGVVLHDIGGAGRWAIACRTDPDALRAAIAQLSSHRKTHQADRTLLVTTAAVPASLRKDVAEPLGVDVWDRKVLRATLDERPEIASAHATSARASKGETRVRALELHDFRGIRDMQLALAQPVTLLVGPDGAGKTAILDALACLLSWPARRVVNRPGGVHVGEQDIHDEATESWIALDAVIDGARARWSVDGQRGRGNRADVRDLEQAARPVRDALQKSAGASVPLFVYYPAHRVVRAMPEPSRKREKLSQIAAHDAALDGQPDFTRFFAWLRQQDDGAPGRRGRSRGGQRDPRLLAVHRAISSVVPGFSDLRIDGNPGHVRVRKQGRDLAFERLSDGERHLLAMAGDLALRLALANPASKDPLQGHGIVLIDEIELHLHPTWQRQIIPALARAFPRCQFVVSTHAPLVIGSVPREAVQVLEDGRLVDMRVHTRGRDATAILAELMGVPPHPPDVTEALLEIGRLIEQSRYEEARVQVDALARDLGDEDAAIVRNRGLLDFLEAPPRPRIAPAGRKKLSRK